MNEFYIPSPYTPSRRPSGFEGGGHGAYVSATKNLRRQSAIAGLCVLAFVGLQFAVYYMLVFLGLDGEFAENDLFQNAFGGIYSAISVFLPFFVVAMLMSKNKREKALAFGRPVSTGLMLLAVPAGFMFCLAGNHVTSIFIVLMQQLGFTLTAPENPVPVGGLESIFFIIQIAVIPPLVEEFALRGVIMQPLRRHGDLFAILMSSIVFSLMHGNLVQAPFALVAGLAIGYYVVATGSIWTGVLIHFVNNLFSSILSLLNAGGIKNVDIIISAIMTIAFVTGLACTLIFFFHPKRIRLNPPEVEMSFGARVTNYVFTVPMLAALLAIFNITRQFVEFNK